MISDVATSLDSRVGLQKPQEFLGLHGKMGEGGRKQQRIQNKGRGHNLNYYTRDISNQKKKERKTKIKPRRGEEKQRGGTKRRDKRKWSEQEGELRQ